MNTNIANDDLDFMEGKRLRRMGIDPDGNPVEIMRQVDRRLAELRAKTAGTDGANQEPTKPD